MEIKFNNISKIYNLDDNLNINYNKFDCIDSTGVNFGNPANTAIPKVATSTIIIQNNTKLPFISQRNLQGAILQIPTEKNSCVINDVLKDNNNNILGLDEYFVIIPIAFVPSRYFQSITGNYPSCWSVNAFIPAKDIFKVGNCRRCPLAKGVDVGGIREKCMYKIVMYYIVLNASQNKPEGTYNLYWYSFKNTGAKVTYHDVIFKDLMYVSKAYQLVYAFKSQQIENRYKSPVWVFHKMDWVKVNKYSTKIEEKFEEVLKYLQKYQEFKLTRVRDRLELETNTFNSPILPPAMPSPPMDLSNILPPEIKE